MTNKVLLKKSSVTSKVPLVSDLDYGEVALNYADGKLFFKDSSNNIKFFNSDLSSYVTLNGSETLTNKTLSSAILTGTLTAGGSVGTSGQVLSSTGTGVQWITPSGGGGSVILTIAGDTGTDNVTVGTDTLTFVGGTGITSSVTDNTVTLDIDSTVATLSGSQTITGTKTFTANQIISVTDNTNAALRITQLGTGNALLVEDFANPDASPFVIDANGNVGIGVTTTAVPLMVRRDQATETLIDYWNATNNSAAAITQRFVTNNVAGSATSTATITKAKTGAFSIKNNDTSGFITLETAGSERVRIGSDGSVGIGTNNPTTKLNVYDATSSSVLIQGDSLTNTVIYRASTDTSSSNVIMRKARGTIASPTAVANGDSLGVVSFQAYGGTTNRALAQIFGVCDSYTADDDLSAALTFNTRPAGSGAAIAERMRIDANGNVTLQKASRGVVATDNDGSFDMNASSNFTCTPTGAFTLTFTNITSGQSGYVLLVNTGGHAISSAATTKNNATFLTTVSTAGTYLISYFSDGTNVYVTTSGAMS